MRVAQSIFDAFEYRRKVAEYKAARQQYDAEVDAYWSAVADKRRLARWPNAAAARTSGSKTTC